LSVPLLLLSLHLRQLLEDVGLICVWFAVLVYVVRAIIGKDS